jgi:von Willebrand factor type A domain
MSKTRAHEDRNATLTWVGGGAVVLVLATALVLVCVFSSADEAPSGTAHPDQQASSLPITQADLPSHRHEPAPADLADQEEWPTPPELDGAVSHVLTPLQASEIGDVLDDGDFLIDPSRSWERVPAHKAYSIVPFDQEYISGLGKDVPVAFRAPAYVRMPAALSLQTALAKKTAKPPLPVKRGNAEVTFLGSTARGQRFCIVADCSGSMRGMPLVLVKQELLKTLAGLKEESQFFVTFFNTQAYPLPSRAWTHGGKKNVEAVVPWVTAVQARGGTNPLPALQLALQLDPRPDVIFLMTDGIFHGTIPNHVKEMNRQTKVPINTILFSWAGPQPQAAAQLRKMADDAGGTFSNVQALRR